MPPPPEREHWTAAVCRLHLDRLPGRQSDCSRESLGQGDLRGVPHVLRRPEPDPPSQLEAEAARISRRVGDVPGRSVFRASLGAGTAGGRAEPVVTTDFAPELAKTTPPRAC